MIHIQFGLIALGLLFGIALEKSKVFIPKLIIHQMLLTDFTMMKVFLTAVVTSTVVATYFESKSEGKNTFNEMRKKYFEKGAFVVVVGGILVGVGMAVSGACPGTVWFGCGGGDCGLGCCAKCN